MTNASGGTNASEGLDINDLSSLSPEEINQNLIHVWSWRGPLYELYANSLMMDYADPAFSKLHRAGSDFFGRPEPENILLMATQNLSSYVMLGWETGILNQFNGLRRNGLSKEEIMELVMFTQLYAGMRGLGHTFRAVGDFLAAFGPPTTEPVYAAGWAPDPDAFKSGLDFSTREMTAEDRSNLEAWYERHVGYVPDSIMFGLKYHPEFVKVNRGKWEVAIRTLPKQFAPHLMIRMNMMTGNVDGLRESVLLGKNWGISRKHVINTLSNTVMYFTSFEGYYTAFKAVDDILEGWQV